LIRANYAIASPALQLQRAVPRENGTVEFATIELCPRAHESVLHAKVDRRHDEGDPRRI